ncbi:SemiSWEET transporter [Dyadobacter jiangsuensis]|uniref:MtN3 and saliva related transmembrane protein n=1 Tax=Dyadobacter jiangsuensis TaxID=1591085 RepID=A0A2P8GJH8_9BACT|nr:SemiSWEET transporter [Dyadobacter jiangsuensis]PSL34117.1 MtN3 and saliva related transmembrane protein [Dyadobacter jiangsuensis]
MSQTVIGIIAGVLTSASMVPQFIKVLRERDAGNLSPLMLLVLICGVGLWTYYGFLKDELPIILSNGFSVLLNSGLLICYFLFRKKGKSRK